MAGSVAKKTADVHSVDSEKNYIQHLENLFQRIYELLLEILETMWTERQETHSIFDFVVTFCVVSKQSFHLSVSPFLLSHFVSCLYNLKSLNDSVLHFFSTHNETNAI